LRRDFSMGMHGVKYVLRIGPFRSAEDNRPTPGGVHG
jgi:hypothetical protein